MALRSKREIMREMQGGIQSVKKVQASAKQKQVVTSLPEPDSPLQQAGNFIRNLFTGG